MSANEIRPAGADPEAWRPVPSVPTAPAPVTDDTAAGAFFRNCYAVLVQGRTVRRHLYFNLPAAERAVRRALGRGDCAEMILVQLVPVRGGRDG